MRGNGTNEPSQRPVAQGKPTASLRVLKPNRVPSGTSISGSMMPPWSNPSASGFGTSASNGLPITRRHLVGDALGLEPDAEVEPRRTQVALGQPEIRNPRERFLVGGDGDQRAVGDARISARRRLDAVTDPAVERHHQRAHGAVMIERVHAVGEHAALAQTADVVLRAGDQVDARLGRRRQVARPSGSVPISEAARFQYSDELLT